MQTYIQHSPLVLRDALISSQIFSKSSSSSSLMIAWTVSFNAHALWRIWRSRGNTQTYTETWRARTKILHINYCIILTVCTWGVPVWVVFEGILPDEIHVLKELFDRPILVEVNLRKNCWQVHRLLDHISVIWYLNHRTKKLLLVGIMEDNSSTNL